jgi:streptomycin 6-kinase
VDSVFQRYLDLWDLTADGTPIVSRSSKLLPVRKNGVAAMLKITEAERSGHLLMRW